MFKKKIQFCDFKVILILTCSKIQNAKNNV